jgi:lipoate-protein ligase B
MIETCAGFGVMSHRREGHPGCWCDAESAQPRKIGALGLRVQRGVSFHGIALNISPALSDFDLIDPCGMPGVTSTSIAVEAGRPTDEPSTTEVGQAASLFARALAGELGIELTGPLPPLGNPADARHAVEALLDRSPGIPSNRINPREAVRA